MNLMDVVCILVILMYVALGFKRGVIKSGVQLIGTVAVLVIAFVFKSMLANFLMDLLPFFDFPGIFHGITAMNILMYELISFILIFVVLYCILSILVNLSGLIEKLLKLTIVLAIPSKLLGALLGLIEGTIMAFLIAFIMLHLSPTEKLVMDSKVAIVVLERTPIISTVSARTTLALEEISSTLHEVKENGNREDANFKALHTLIYYKIISQEDAQKLIDEGKLRFTNQVVI